MLVILALCEIQLTYAIEHKVSTDNISIISKPQNAAIYHQDLETNNTNSVKTNAPIVAAVKATQDNILPIKKDALLQQDVIVESDVYTFGLGFGLSSLGGQIAITGPLNNDRSVVFRIIHNDLELYGIQDGLEDDDTLSITKEFTDPTSTITANLGLDIHSTGLIFDWHPWVDGVAFSLGVLQNNFAINITANSQSSVPISQTINNDTYAVQADIAALTSVDVNYEEQYVPYIGIRFSNALAPSWPVSFYLDIGAIHAGSLAYSDIVLTTDIDLIANQVQADLQTTAGVNNYTLSAVERDQLKQEIQVNIDKIEKQANEDLADLKDLLTWFPVISLGIQISF
jgi:hypothetical protein